MRFLIPLAVTLLLPAAHADFRSIIRYAQCWEDADILMAGLDIQPGNVCLSIASAGLCAAESHKLPAGRGKRLTMRGCR